MPDGPLPREASGPERGLSARRDELSCREGRWESPPLAIARGCEGGGGAGLLFWGVASERGGCMIIVEVSDASRLAEGGGTKDGPDRHYHETRGLFHHRHVALAPCDAPACHLPHDLALSRCGVECGHRDGCCCLCGETSHRHAWRTDQRTTDR